MIFVSAERFDLSHSPGDLVAIHPGQPEIQEDHIGSECRRLGEGLESIAADLDLVAGGLQHPAKAEGIVHDCPRPSGCALRCDSVSAP